MRQIAKVCEPSVPHDVQQLYIRMLSDWVLFVDDLPPLLTTSEPYRLIAAAVARAGVMSLTLTGEPHPEPYDPHLRALLCGVGALSRGHHCCAPLPRPVAVTATQPPATALKACSSA